MQKRVFITICFGFTFGIFIRSYISLDFYSVLLLSIISFMLFLFFYFVSKSKLGILASIFILVFSFGVLRFHIADQASLKSEAILSDSVGQKVSLTGIITEEVSQKENSQSLTVEVEKAGETTDILLSVGLAEDLKYGDKINFSGVLEKPENFVTDQGKEFDYVNYLRKDGILYVMKYPVIDVVSSGNGSKIKSTLFAVKEKFMEKINYAIPDPENLLMGGLILGEKSSFDQALRQSFVDTGTIHIVALSGYNVTIVAEWIMKIFAFLPKNMGISLGIFSVLLFVVMTGANSTALRAGIMATLALVARATGRNYDVARALILAGVLMILINPFLLVFDVSFQLSFIATVAVIFLAPKIEKHFLWVTPRLGLRDIITVTCAAYIFVLPFILYEMGNLSIVALPANVLVLPFIPLTMILGFITGFAGLILPILSIPIGFVSYLFLHYELFMINLFSHLNFAAFTIPNFPLVLTVGIYVYFVYKIF